MKRIKYEELLKITRPVLLFLELWDGSDAGARLRILSPDGTCEYVRMDGFTNTEEFTKSCFQGEDLNLTVERMRRFDTEMLDGTLYLVDEL